MEKNKHDDHESESESEEESVISVAESLPAEKPKKPRTEKQIAGNIEAAATRAANVLKKKEEKLKQAKVLSKIFEKEMSKSAIDKKTEKIEKRLKQQVREKLERDRIEALKRIYE